MKQISLVELRSNPQYWQQVADGEPLLVMRQGQPIAVIRPYRGQVPVQQTAEGWTLARSRVQAKGQQRPNGLPPAKRRLAFNRRKALARAKGKQ